VDLALKAGKHVFCEWPLGANLKQAMESRDLAESKGVRHMVGLQARGAPEFSYVKELVGEGYIGQVLSATLNQSLPGAGTRVATFPEGVDRTQGVGTLAIAGGHSIDALCFCLGEFRELSGVVSTQVKKALVKETGALLDVTAPDNVSVSGTLASGGGRVGAYQERPRFWDRHGPGDRWYRGVPGSDVSWLSPDRGPDPQRGTQGGQGSSGAACARETPVGAVRHTIGGALQCSPTLAPIRRGDQGRLNDRPGLQPRCHPARNARRHSAVLRLGPTPSAPDRPRLLSGSDEAKTPRRASRPMSR
jgi:predicted dehydrogenase